MSIVSRQRSVKRPTNVGGRPRKFGKIEPVKRDDLFAYCRSLHTDDPQAKSRKQSGFGGVTRIQRAVRIRAKQCVQPPAGWGKVQTSTEDKR